MYFEADPINKLKPLNKKNLKFSRTLTINTPGLTSFIIRGWNPQMVALFLTCFLKGIN